MSVDYAFRRHARMYAKGNEAPYKGELEQQHRGYNVYEADVTWRKTEEWRPAS